jgi:hypothetical protein
MLKQTPLTAAGGTYNNHYHFLFEPRGSKISVYHEHFDSAHVNEVIGLNALETEKPRAMASLETRRHQHRNFHALWLLCIASAQRIILLAKNLSCPSCRCWAEASAGGRSLTAPFSQ